MLPQILVAQLGARRHYAVPCAFYSAGMLYELHTDWCANIGLARWITKAVPRRFQPAPLRRLGQRLVPELPSDRIKTHPGLTLGLALGRKRHRGPAAQYQRYLRINAAFGQQVVRHGFGKANAVYGFNAAALEIFQAARTLGLTTILDQPIAPWAYVENLLHEERQQWPGWEENVPDAEDWGPLADREQAEWELADQIVCGSEFVVHAIQSQQGPSQRCHIVPHAVTLPGPRRERSFAADRPLRVLFVGTVELRKGLPYLLEAAKLFGPHEAEFRVVGPVCLSRHAIELMARRLDLRGRVSRREVAMHYRWADVFVLPTLAEGSANVCYEALAHGLPVITTFHAGSVIRNGTDGFLIPIRSSEAIADCLLQLRCQPDRLAALSEQARDRVSCFSIQRYQEQLVAAVCSNRQGSSQDTPDL